MKLKANIGTLTEALRDISNTLDTMSQMPTAQAHMKAINKGEGEQWLYLYSTDLTSETVLKIPAEVETEGECLFSPSQMLNGALLGRAIEDSIQLSLVEEGKRLKVQYKQSRSHLGVREDTNGAVASCRKNLPSATKSVVSLKASDMAEFCRRTMFCIPTDDNGQARQVIGGMYFVLNADGTYEVQATDGSIAAQVKIVGDRLNGKLSDFMIPVKALNPVARLLSRHRDEDVQIVPGPVGEHGIATIYFKLGDAMFGTRLLNGKFPALKQLMDNVKVIYTFDVDKEALKGALSRASAFFEKGKSRAIRMDVKKDHIELRARNTSDDTVDTLDIVHRVELEEPISLVFQMDYLFNIVMGSAGQWVTIGVKDPLSALLITDESDERVQSKYMLMPIKI